MPQLSPFYKPLSNWECTHILGVVQFRNDRAIQYTRATIVTE
jgi:hypothetical protein